MSLAGSQAQTFLRLLQPLRVRWRRDPALPRVIQTLLTGERSFGSRDRRLYRELIYTTLRHLPWIEPLLDADPAEAVRRVAWLAAETPATARFRLELATGSPPAGNRHELLPSWFETHQPRLFVDPELEFQLRRAPLWLRAQGDANDRSTLEAEFAARGWNWRQSDVLPDALELRSEADVTQTEAWRTGRVEIQDLGSQLLLESAGIEPGGHWLDLCAGAGGKSLQLARLLGPRGRVSAHDIRAVALEELQRRAERARLGTIRLLRSLPAAADHDGVLVDAPCSGSGTWRRAPHLKWCTTPELIAERADLQLRLLLQGSSFVRPGGRLLYATCSLSRVENEDVVARFLSAAPRFSPEPPLRDFRCPAAGPGLLILPSHHDTDGFFVAAFRRR